MAVLERISDLINKSLPTYANATIIPRGVTIPADPFLTGSVRFARKSGEFQPVISPDTTTALSTNAVATLSTIKVNNLPTWYVLGALLSLEGREIVTISDIDTTTNTITLLNPLASNHASGSSVTLFGVPILINGNVAKGQTIFSIKSAYTFFVGDVFLIDRVEYNVTAATFVGIDPGTQLGVWQLTLASGIHRALIDEETDYLRAYPAYTSKIVYLPSSVTLSTAVVGPVLLDWVSATFVTGQAIAETMTVQFYNAAQLPIGN